MVFVISMENNKILCSSLKSGNKCLNIEIPIIWKKTFFVIDVLVDLLWLYHAVAGVALYFFLISFMHFSNRFYRTSYEFF